MMKEPKFKVGDKVIPTTSERYKNSYDRPLEVMEVKAVNGGGFMYHLYDSNICWAGLYSEKELIAVTLNN